MLSICLEFFKLQITHSIQYLSLNKLMVWIQKKKNLIARLQRTYNPPVSIARHQLC